MMNMEINQTDDLARKTNRKWEELLSLEWNLFFVLSYLSMCESSVHPLPFSSNSRVSAMHHGTIDR